LKQRLRALGKKPETVSGINTAAKVLLCHSLPQALIKAVPAHLRQQQPATATKVCVALCDNYCKLFTEIICMLVRHPWPTCSSGQNCLNPSTAAEGRKDARACREERTQEQLCAGGGGQHEAWLG